MNNKTYLITGATSGVGKAIALELANQNANLILTGRNKERGKKVIEEIKENTGNSDIDFYYTDLSLVKNIREFSQEIKEKYSRIDLLANCMGAIFPKYEETDEGFEKTFATTYLSHFVLTNSVIDLLKAAGNARIITVAGGKGMINRAKIDFDNLQMKNNYGGFKAAIQTAAMRVMFSNELAKRLKDTGITSNSFNPGAVQSNLGRQIPILKILAKLSTPFFSKKCKICSYLALSKEVEGITGKFFSGKRGYTFNNDTINNADKLWLATEKMLDINEK